MPRPEGKEWWLVRWVFTLACSPFGPAGSGRPRGILHLFSWIERVLDRLAGPRPIRPGGIVRYDIGRFPARPLPLPGQPPVRRGETAIILHFDGRAVADLATSAPSQNALLWRLMRVARDDFAELARMAREGGFPPGLRVVWSETPIYAGLVRLGFAIRPSPPSLRTPFARLYFLTLIAIYGREGVRPMRDGRSRHLGLGEAWMPLEELERRYGGRGV
ncbi:MAG: hypothetical protein JOZ41_14765 [Chloroflexi bacterium]|nr:hypothetical protein [Chloroflexota bacterium]